MKQLAEGFALAIEIQQPGDRVATHYGEPNAEVLDRVVTNDHVVLTIRVPHTDPRSLHEA